MAIYKQQAQHSHRIIPVDQSVCEPHVKKKGNMHERNDTKRTGDGAILNVKIVRPSSSRRAPKCCMARPTCTASVWICALRVGSEEDASCSRRPAICYNNVVANYKEYIVR